MVRELDVMEQDQEKPDSHSSTRKGSAVAMAQFCLTPHRDPKASETLITSQFCKLLQAAKALNHDFQWKKRNIFPEMNYYYYYYFIIIIIILVQFH